MCGVLMSLHISYKIARKWSLFVLVRVLRILCIWKTWLKVWNYKSVKTWYLHGSFKYSNHSRSVAIIGRDFKFSQFVSSHMGTMYTNIEGNPTYFLPIERRLPYIQRIAPIDWHYISSLKLLYLINLWCLRIYL